MIPRLPWAMALLALPVLATAPLGARASESLEVDPLGLLVGGEDCSSATDITSNTLCDGNPRRDSQLGMDTAQPGGSPTGSCWAGDATENDRWLKFRNTTGGPVMFRVHTDDPGRNPPPSNSQIAVWDGCVAASEIACSDDISPANLLSDTGTFPVASGQTIYIQFDGFMGNSSWNAGYWICGLAPAPEVVVATCPVFEDCGGIGGDGTIDPGDTLTFQVRFENLGAAAAVDFRATLAATGATILTGASVGGAPPVDIAAGSSHTHTLTARVSAACGERIEIDILNMTAQGGFQFTDDRQTCDQQVEAGPGCVACACTPVVPTGSVGNALRAAKRGALELDWSRHGVSPPRFALFKTSSKDQVAETPQGIGDETALGVSAATAYSEALGPPSELFQVLPADSCDGPVFP